MEYQQVCLLLGRTKDALQLGHRQMALTGGTADARSNLAVALLLDGDLDAADAEAAEAAVLAPDDAINESIRRAIADVREGRRPQPRTLRDLGPAAAAPIPTKGLEPGRHGAPSRKHSVPTVRFWRLTQVECCRPRSARGLRR